MPVSAFRAEMAAGAIGAGFRDSDFAALLVEHARNAGLEMHSELIEAKRRPEPSA